MHHPSNLPVHLLLTGFSHFPGVSVNPTEAVLPLLARQAEALGMRVNWRVLPVEYAAVDHLVPTLLDLQPDLWLALGLSGRATALTLEGLARNADTASGPDAAGVRRSHQPIATNGPAHYPATLPFDAIEAALQRHGVPVARSSDAGGYLCNHLYYQACHAIASRAQPTRVGFIHVPPLQPELPEAPLADLASLVHWLAPCLTVLAATASV